jgi:hypothetical protein
MHIYNVFTNSLKCVFTSVDESEVCTSAKRNCKGEMNKVETTHKIVIYEPSARRHFSHMSALFEAQATKERVLHLRERAEYVFAHRGLYNIF